jgi:transcriptional regulator with XRE-family HTH domain
MDEFDRRVAVELGRRVRRRRHFLDLSQETLALRAGVHRTQVSLWENGERMPLTSTLVRLAGALESSPDQLLAGARWEPPGSPQASVVEGNGSSATRRSVLRRTMPERDEALAVAGRFGENLRRVRKREDLSQERLAKRASLHRTEIGLLEKGERLCRIDTLVRLVGAMAVSPAELLDGIDWVPGPETHGVFAFSPGPTSPRPRPGNQEVSE